MTRASAKPQLFICMAISLASCVMPSEWSGGDYGHYGKSYSQLASFYECPRINGVLDLFFPKDGYPARLMGGGSFDYPNGTDSGAGPITEDCSDDQTNCMAVTEPLPGHEFVIMSPKNITKTGSYNYRGHIAYVERYLGKQRKMQNNKQVIIRIPIGPETEDRNIVLLVEDKIGVTIVDGIRMVTNAQTDGSRNRIMDIGQCTFVSGKALFSGTRVNLAADEP